MRFSRARFKYALRQCKLDERLIVSEKLADHIGALLILLIGDFTTITNHIARIRIMKLTIFGKI